MAGLSVFMGNTLLAVGLAVIIMCDGLGMRMTVAREPNDGVRNSVTRSMCRAVEAATGSPSMKRVPATDRSKADGDGAGAPMTRVCA